MIEAGMDDGTGADARAETEAGAADEGGKTDAPGGMNAGSDADDAAWVPVGELASHDLPEKAREVVAEGLRRCGVLGYTLK